MADVFIVSHLIFYKLVSFFYIYYLRGHICHGTHVEVTFITYWGYICHVEVTFIICKGHISHGTYVDVRGKPAQTGSFLLACEFQGSNANHKNWLQVPLPGEPPSWVPLYFLKQSFPWNLEITSDLEGSTCLGAAMPDFQVGAWARTHLPVFSQ